ncbi:MAG: iron transporter [Burkholderiaceae bacterium]
MKTQAPSWAAGLAIASRALCALLGGYALASAFTAFFSLALPLHRSEAVLTASMLSFAVYTAAAIFVFSARSATRAWAWTLGPAALLAAGVFAVKGL